MSTLQEPSPSSASNIFSELPVYEYFFTYDVPDPRPEGMPVVRDARHGFEAAVKANYLSDLAAEIGGLVISELGTNADVHSKGLRRIVAGRIDGHLFIGVVDGGVRDTAKPLTAEQTFMAGRESYEGGRGSQLLDELCDASDDAIVDLEGVPAHMHWVTLPDSTLAA